MLNNLKQLLPFLQILTSLILICLILLQQKAGGLLGKETGFYRTLRGAEKKIFWVTVFLILLFIILGLLNLLI
jgi:protein translocase SecG subunit